MNLKTIGIKDLHQQLSQVIAATQKGQSFMVFKNRTPVFRIEPILPHEEKKYTLQSFLNIQFKTRDKNLSKKIDKIAYGV